MTKRFFLLLSYYIAYHACSVVSASDTRRSAIPSSFSTAHQLQFYYSRGYRARDLWSAIDDADFILLSEILDCECVYLEERDEQGQTALHRALRLEEEEMALELIDAGADVNAHDALLWTPLHFASRYQLVLAARLLLERGADVNAANESQDRAVSFAVLGESTTLLEILISNGAEINFVDSLGRTPLHTAAIYGEVDVAQFLIERGANTTAEDHGGQAPEDVICLCLELEMTCSEGACTRTGVNAMRSVFRRAERRGDSSRSRTAEFDLWIAVVNGTVQEVEEILDCSCTIPTRGRQIPGCPCVEVHAVTQTDTSDWDGGQTALHLAVLRKNVAICRMLIGSGARTDFRNSDGDTPLHLATRDNSTDIVELILTQNVSTSTQNNEGQTALHVATRYGLLQIVRLLVQHGAALRLPDDYGATPLEIVCICLLMEDCPERSCRNAADIVDLLTALGEEDEEDHLRAVELFFPSNIVRTRISGESFSDTGDAALSLAAFIGTLYFCATVFLFAFGVSAYIMRRRLAWHRRQARMAQRANNLGP